MNQRVARAMRAANRHYADGGDVQDNRSMFSRAADTAMDYAGRGLALGDLYTGGMLSSLAGLNPFTSYSDVMAAREKALAGVPREAKALATEPVNPLMAMAAAPAAIGTRAGRIVDNLGFYSKLDEVLGSLGQKDKVTAATLQQRGVKAAEIEARRLNDLLAGGKAVPAADLAKVAGENRLTLNEVQRGSDLLANPTKWSANSLDPSNPTYRETVIHLPNNADTFKSGHFPEPNIIGHMMTSMTSHQGRPVYTIDQIQSDWGQKLRDGGGRDDVKIAALRARLAELGDDVDSQMFVEADEFLSEIGEVRPSTLPINEISDALERVWRNLGKDDYSQEIMDRAASIQHRFDAEQNERMMLEAELSTAESLTPRNPLVNTTDQWVNTTLRRALRAATDQNADYVAIPSGRTVLSYNPGDTHGMTEFYDHIVPRRAQDILGKLDKQSAVPLRVDQVATPTKGLAGQGFTLFNLTPKAKEEIRRGLPMFGAAGLGLLAGYPEDFTE